MKFVDAIDAIYAILPNATFDEDKNGQVVIYTGKRAVIKEENGRKVEYLVRHYED
jgi:hypothetical protein